MVVFLFEVFFALGFEVLALVDFLVLFFAPPFFGVFLEALFLDADLSLLALAGDSAFAGEAGATTSVVTVVLTFDVLEFLALVPLVAFVVFVALGFLGAFDLLLLVEAFLDYNRRKYYCRSCCFLCHFRILL